MSKLSIVLATLLLTTNTAFAAGNDDPVLGMLLIDQFEYRMGDEDNSVVLDAQGWIGKDLNKLWLKAEAESVDGETDEAELQALYSRAIAPFWDLQLGWRRNFKPEPSLDWFAFGIQGLAPYWFEVDAAAFIGENSRTAARLEAEYEFLFTQKLILVPELELKFYGKDDPEYGIGSGLANTEFGLRLRYEIRREFAPYIGVNWENLHGQTASYAEDEGHETSEFQYSVGVRAWF
jgi:copper resistance protein B